MLSVAASAQEPEDVSRARGAPVPILGPWASTWATPSTASSPSEARFSPVGSDGLHYGRMPAGTRGRPCAAILGRACRCRSGWVAAPAYPRWAVPHAAMGVHVPARRLRFDVEAGDAWPVRDEERDWRPQSWACPTPRPTCVRSRSIPRKPGRVAIVVGRVRTGSARPRPPPAFDRAVDDILDDLRATYGASEPPLRRDRGSPDLDGDVATFDADFEGSVVEIATGERISDGRDRHVRRGATGA